jgi:hypothetical protein
MITEYEMRISCRMPRARKKVAAQQQRNLELSKKQKLVKRP